ncbi:hypothetical protein ASF75_14085 [Curtobacterium sp. Leaf154]|nr:hypothetical protein ASF75_14085 [Curtobacterium sp. Leaf154]
MPAMTSPVAADGHPQLGSTHKNGDRRFGVAGLLSRVYAGRGTPMLSSPYHSTVTEHIGSVRVGDELHVEWRGTHWWATSDEGTVGRLSWSKGLRGQTAYVPDGPSSYDFDDGTLYVQHVTVNAAGEVVDCGGYVVPDDYEPSDWPMTPMPDPAERELTIMIGVPAPQPVDSSAPGVAPLRRRGWLDRLMGR